MSLPISLYLWPGQTHFGFGAAKLVGQEARNLAASHIFLIADPGVVKAGVIQPILDSLEAAKLSYTLWDKVVPNPTAESVNEAAQIYRQCRADLIVTVGGGSGIDTGKGVRVLAGAPNDVKIHEYSFLIGDKRRLYPQAQEMPLMIAIPTTAGTGAEVTPWAVITDVANKQKFGIGNASTIPTVALIDPEMTLSLPAFLTAATGIDALTHCIEAYVSPNHNPALDPMILHGIEQIGQNLRTATYKGNNTEARYNVMLGSMIGGIAISSKWLGACHSLAHPLSALANLQHGVANGIMLPYQMAYSLPGALERYARVAAALDPAYADPSVSLRQRAEGAVSEVESLLEDCGLPTRLRDAGVTEELLEPLGAAAIKDANWVTNPRPVDQGILTRLYREAF